MRVMLAAATLCYSDKIAKKSKRNGRIAREMAREGVVPLESLSTRESRKNPTGAVKNRKAIHKLTQR